MVSLHGKADEPEPVALPAAGERGRDGAETAATAQVPHVGQDTERRVHWMSCSERRPTRVRHAGPRALGLPSRALALSTPGAQVQLELLRLLRHASCVADASDIAAVERRL